MSWLINDLVQLNTKIHSGGNRSSLFGTSDDEDLTKELNKALSNLEFVTKGLSFPFHGLSLTKMQCIEHNPNSDYVKRNSVLALCNRH